MKTKDIIFNYLLENSNKNGEIKITNSTIAYLLNIPTRTVVYSLNLLRDEQKLIKRGKTVNILNKEQHIINNITNGLNYSDREKTLLLYIYKCYLIRNLNYDYICISRKNIHNNTGIENDSHITEYIQKFINDNLIEVIQGDWTKNKSNKYKILFDNNNNDNNDIIPMEQEGKVVMSSTEFQQLNERINKMSIAFKQMMLENSQMKQKIELLEKQLNIPTKSEIEPEQQFEQVQIFEQVQQEIPQPIVEPIETNSERDNIYQQYLNNKEKVIEHIKGLEKNLDDNTTHTLNGIVSKVMATNDIQLVYNVCGLDYNKVLYLIPILDKVQDNIIYMYLMYKDFQEIIMFYIY